MQFLHNVREATFRLEKDAYKLLRYWVVRAALLVLGTWCAFPQPPADSF